MPRVNAHSLADYGIATGRLPLDGRTAFLARFADDPVRATGELLLTPATRDAGRQCPLFAAPRADRSAASAKGHTTRSRRASAFAEVAEAAARAAVEHAGQDADDPEIKRAVADALRKVAEEEKARLRRQRRSRAERERRAHRDGREIPPVHPNVPAFLAAVWGTPEEDAAMRQEAFAALDAELAEVTA